VLLRALAATAKSAHQRIPQVDFGGRVIWRLGHRRQQQQLALQPTLPAEAVSGQVEQHPEQVRLRIAVKPAPVPDDPLQRRLQQVLAGLPAARQQDRRAHQLVGPLGEKGLKLAHCSVVCHLPPS
jgi:hypothetical protein